MINVQLLKMFPRSFPDTRITQADNLHDNKNRNNISIKAHYYWHIFHALMINLTPFLLCSKVI